MRFVTLKSASVDCKLGVKLNNVIKDKFMAGIKPIRILDRVCEKDSEVFERH